jgi:hypothetical protein
MVNCFMQFLLRWGSGSVGVGLGPERDPPKGGSRGQVPKAKAKAAAGKGGSSVGRRSNVDVYTHQKTISDFRAKF